MARLKVSHWFTKPPLQQLLWLVLCAWLLSLQPGVAQAHLRSVPVQQDAVAAANAQTPPPAVTTGNGPAALRRVKINFFINAISQINDQDGSYQLDCYLNFYWYDPALEGKTIDEIDQSTLWDPLIEPVNSQAYQLVGRTYSSSLEPRTNVRLSYRLIGTFYNAFDLRRFPFDQQVLTFQIESSEFDSGQLLFDFVGIDALTVYGDQPVVNVVPKGKYLTPDLQVPGWELGELQVVQQIHVLPYDKSSWAQFRVDLAMTRQSTSYLWQVFLELGLLQLLFGSVLFLESQELFARLLLLFTLLMVTVVFNFIALQNTPDTAVLTILEQAILLCYFAIGLVAALVLTNKWLHQSGQVHWAMVVNRWARLGYPLVLAVLNGYLFWLK